MKNTYQLPMQMQPLNTQPSQIGQNPIQSSVFANQDINGFAQIIKQKGLHSPNSLFARANDRDIQILFDNIDTNKNGKIDENEAKAISGVDGDNSSLSDEDFTSLCQKIYDSMCENDRIAAQQAYQNQFGGTNYQNYGSRMGNGSYINTQEQYSTKKKLEDIRDSKIFKNDKRQTEILNLTSNSNLDMRDYVKNEPVIITYSTQGMIKAVRPDEFKTTRRNTMGVTNKTLREDEYICNTLTLNTHDNLLLFSDIGRCYLLPVFKVPISGRNNASKSINNFLSLS
jgi:hypothetical protein